MLPQAFMGFPACRVHSAWFLSDIIEWPGLKGTGPQWSPDFNPSLLRAKSPATRPDCPDPHPAWLWMPQGWPKKQWMEAYEAGIHRSRGRYQFETVRSEKTARKEVEMGLWRSLEWDSAWGMDTKMVFYANRAIHITLRQPFTDVIQTSTSLNSSTFWHLRAGVFPEEDLWALVGMNEREGESWHTRVPAGPDPFLHPICGTAAPCQTPISFTSLDGLVLFNLSFPVLNRLPAGFI